MKEYTECARQGRVCAKCSLIISSCSEKCGIIISIVKPIVHSCGQLGFLAIVTLTDRASVNILAGFFFVHVQGLWRVGRRLAIGDV